MADDSTAMRNDLDNLAAAVRGTETKRIEVILCGTTAEGVIVPLLVDADGKLMLSS